LTDDLREPSSSSITHSIVVPVYRNEPTLSELLRQIADLAGQRAGSLEVVFVVDGSPDNSYALLKQRLAGMPFQSQLVSLSRNFGSFAALRAGLSLVRGSFIGILAADLQQPVSSITRFFDVLERGADIAVGQRSSRSDPWLSQLSASLFWQLYRRFVQPEIPPGGVDSFGCTREVCDILVALPEANSTLVGLLFWVGFRRETVTYQRVARPSGKSGWSLTRKLRYAFDTTFAFSDLPITLMIAAGVVGISGALLLSAVVMVAWATGAIPVQGYTPLMLVALFSFSTTLLALGIVGGYVWRIFENTKGRPTHLIQSVEHIAGAAPVQAFHTDRGPDGPPPD
jgi:polyisoprenyl-phosphate glycosyltransferase